MNWRKFIIGLIIASGVIALILAGLIGVVKYKPTLLGLKDPSDTSKVEKKVEMPKAHIEPLKAVYIEPTVEISQAQLYDFQWQVQQKNEMIVKFDSLKRIEKYLRDSIKSNSETLKSYQDSLKRANLNANNAMKNKDVIKDSLASINEELRKTKQKYETAQKRIDNYDKRLESKLDTASQSNFQTFAKMYDVANPANVAKILEQLDERDAAKILKLMNKKKSGKVLEAMKPENAAAILLLGVGQ